jgi:hypothetical protein
MGVMFRLEVIVVFFSEHCLEKVFGFVELILVR